VARRDRSRSRWGRGIKSMANAMSF
jgi:hypothetical protein